MPAQRPLFTLGGPRSILLRKKVSEKFQIARIKQEYMPEANFPSSKEIYRVLMLLTKFFFPQPLADWGPNIIVVIQGRYLIFRVSEIAEFKSGVN